MNEDEVLFHMTVIRTFKYDSAFLSLLSLIKICNYNNSFDSFVSFLSTNSCTRDYTAIHILHIFAQVLTQLLTYVLTRARGRTQYNSVDDRSPAVSLAHTRARARASILSASLLTKYISFLYI